MGIASDIFLDFSAQSNVDRQHRESKESPICNRLERRGSSRILISLMRKLLSIALALSLEACTSAKSYDPPFNPNEKAEKQIPPFYGMGMPGYMSRQEVIAASTECEDAGMLPRIVYMQMTVLEKKVPVPIDVHCEPKRRLMTSPYVNPRKD